MTALQAGPEEPVHLVVHDKTVDPLAEQAAGVRRGERGEGVAPHVGVAGRRQAERRPGASPAVSTSLAPAAPARAMSRRMFCSNNANIGAS